MNERLPKLFTIQIWALGIIGAGVFMFNVSHADAFLFGYLFLALAPLVAWRYPFLSAILHVLGLLWLPSLLLIPTPSAPLLLGEPIDAPCGFAGCPWYFNYADQIILFGTTLFIIVYALPVIHTLHTINQLRSR